MKDKESVKIVDLYMRKYIHILNTLQNMVNRIVNATFYCQSDPKAHIAMRMLS